jgi:hypothetical protein
MNGGRREMPILDGDGNSVCDPSCLDDDGDVDALAEEALDFIATPAGEQEPHGCAWSDPLLP